MEAPLKGKPEERERERKEGRTTFETDRYETAESFPELLDSKAPSNSKTGESMRRKVSRKNRASRDDGCCDARSCRKVTCGCLILGWLRGGI